MYFPRNISEISNLIQSLSGYDIEEKIRILDNIIREIDNMPLFANNNVRDLLYQYKVALERENQEDSIERLKDENNHLQKELQVIHSKLQEKEFLQNLLIKLSGTQDIKPYRNICIFLLSHPRNNSTATAEILSRINYLDKMTRDVTFIMPGYKRAEENDDVVNEIDTNLQLTFDEDVFINMVQELEDKSNGMFNYKDECELVFVALFQNGQYDFENMIRLNLNILSKERGIDAIKLILTVAQRFRSDKDKEGKIEIKKNVSQIIGELAMEENRPTLKVFIAGSKSLKKERSLIREELNRVENKLDIDIRTLTFEDFATSLTGKERGRQADYNKFIENDANVVIFIFSHDVGEITEEEFNIAYDSLTNNQHPEIFVYAQKTSITGGWFKNRQLRDIKKKVFCFHREYYVEYRTLQDLRYCLYRDMVSYFQSFSNLKNKN